MTNDQMRIGETGEMQPLWLKRTAGSVDNHQRNPGISSNPLYFNHLRFGTDFALSHCVRRVRK